MKKNLFLMIVSMILITGIGVFMLTQKNSNSQQEIQEIKDAANSQSNQPQLETPVTQSKYRFFTPEIFNAANNSRRVLFFYANWCPICQPANKSFTENQVQIPEDVTVIRVNYDDNETESAEKELAQKYGVTYQHTFVQIDEEGKVVTTWNGGAIDELLNNIK